MASKCNKCNKSFKTVKSLQQHQRDAHGSSQAMAAPRASLGKRRNRRLAGRGSGGGMRGIDTNPSRVRPVSGGRMRISGEDRMEIVTTKAGSSLFHKIPITIGTTSRLNMLAKAFQRIKWLDVSVTVTPQVSLTVSGGYVAGIVMDPTDLSVTAKQLSATQGSQTKKWFESTTVRMPKKNDLLYTSMGDDPRLSIPATFWIITEGKPTSDVSIVFTLNYTVELSGPTVESSIHSLILKGNIWALANNYNLEYRLGNEKSQDFSEIMPPELLAGDNKHFFRCPTFTLQYAEGTGDTGTLQAHFLVFDSKDKKMYWSSDGQNIGTTVWQSGVNVECVVPCGTVCKYVGTGNECSGVNLGPPSSNSKISKSSSEELITLTKALLKVTTSFSRFVTSSNTTSLKSTNDLDSSRDEWIELSEI